MTYEADPTPDDLTPNPDILQVDTQVDPEPPVVYLDPADSADQTK